MTPTSEDGYAVMGQGAKTLVFTKEVLKFLQLERFDSVSGLFDDKTNAIAMAED